MNDRRLLAWRAAALCGILLAISFAAGAQATAPNKTRPARAGKRAAGGARVSLSPRFIPGQTFRYEMEWETTTDMARSGVALDPQGPASVVVDWNATVRVEILSADAATPGGIRLRTTYEKSTASVRSDTFDPEADDTSRQYRQLEGKVVEFTLDANGKVKSASGIEGMAGSESEARSARDWIAQLSASAGAPLGGVSVGQTWSSEQPADSLPIAGLVWRTDSQYLRNEPCRPPNPDLPASSGAANAAVNPQPAADCAVILANLSLVRPKTARDSTSPELRKNGVQSSGKWSGSGQSLVYVSLATGLVVSATQTATEQMDVTLTSNRNASLRYAGTISSRSQVGLATDGGSEK